MRRRGAAAEHEATACTVRLKCGGACRARTLCGDNGRRVEAQARQQRHDDVREAGADRARGDGMIPARRKLRRFDDDRAFKKSRAELVRRSLQKHDTDLAPRSTMSARP